MEIKNWKRVGLGAVTLLSAAVLAACGNSSSSSSSSSDEINWYVPTEISTLDISKVTDTYSSIAIGNSGSNLLRRDEDGELQPDLAEKVEVSDDGLTYTATLRDDLKWSDGSDLTAEDFVYSWQRIVDPTTASEYAYLVSDAHVLNAEEVIAGTKSVDELGVKADGNKVIFTLSNPSPQFMSLLSFANFMPQSKDFVEEAGDDYGTTSEKSLYSGPYTVEDWNGTSGTFTLVKNKYYWDAKDVKTKKVNVQTIKKPDTAVQMYKDGDLDYATISNTEATYKANKNRDDVVPLPEATTAYMVYNQTGTVAALNNTKIRQALNLATDREGIVKAAIDTGSTAATALAPTGLETLPDGTDLAEYVSPGYSYDEEEAAKLFKEGLAELGTDSVTLTITSDSDSPVAKASVDYIKQTWEENLPGLTVEEKFVAFKQRLEDTKNQNFDVALVLWGGDYPEGSTFYGLFTTNSSYNYGKFSNADYDAAYEKAITTDALDPAAAADDYKAAEKALYDNALYNPIYFRSYEALQNPNLKGLVRSSTGLSVDFTYAYKE
ncbi:oligopeptide transport system substrate-binding protein [Streptococcus gallolyticus]|uniref:Oligopeptide transport system substrate-binding protein n=1 Tax=Streptococcus gallolyticus TaxID=315405 RepID=A0A1H7WXG9_9STRE|nr:peptide ABC transporter substrate-binding protein [Streptococcus gallolyticus]MCY7171821.1 peptide ABC transporter substrate-binding protein [Streptococcus gallolyticus subsp. gallolyticus]MCY7186920.1 peptide ABC transporter substrate-binding protein [Streptococcus gallolyticus subsp. gallolyticus]SEF24879.1 oligopeptide transport system substrate-binding protein [Streptococcus gallolyticus]SEM26193.1 oligopeptide transport system substrate-binding protein [Streptococcus gallolyticus]SER08